MNHKTIKTDMVEKWESLFATLTVVCRSPLLCSDAEIERAERDLGFRFPTGYKEFCQVFGSGSFGDFIRIYCPCPTPTSYDRGFQFVGLSLNLEMAVDSGELTPDEDKGILLNRLLMHGYPFGDTINADSFFWDLTSYSEADHSFDIYWVPDGEAMSVTKVGRNFFEFVSEFCLGPKLNELLPGAYAAIASRNQNRVFTAFDLGSADGKSEDQFELFLKMNEGIWERMVGFGLAEDTKVKLSVSYHAPGKDQAELLKRAWEKETECEIKIISGGASRNISCLVEVTISERIMTKDYLDELLSKMIAIGRECNCVPGSLGTQLIY